MRSTAFDMIGMTLVALVVIAACGGMITYAYFAQSRWGRRLERTEHHDATSRPDDPR